MPGRITKNTAVYDLFLGVLGQNELSSCFIALKKNSLGIVCLHRFSFRTKSIPFVFLLSSNQKKTPGPMLRSAG